MFENIVPRLSFRCKNIRLRLGSFNIIHLLFVSLAQLQYLIVWFLGLEGLEFRGVHPHRRFALTPLRSQIPPGRSPGFLLRRAYRSLPRLETLSGVIPLAAQRCRLQLQPRGFRRRGPCRQSMAALDFFFSKVAGSRDTCHSLGCAFDQRSAGHP